MTTATRPFGASFLIQASTPDDVVTPEGLVARKVLEVGGMPASV